MGRGRGGGEDKKELGRRAEGKGGRGGGKEGARLRGGEGAAERRVGSEVEVGREGRGAEKCRWRGGARCRLGGDAAGGGEQGVGGWCWCVPRDRAYWGHGWMAGPLASAVM